MIYTFNQVSQFIDNKDLINSLVIYDNPNIPPFFRDSFDIDSTMERLEEYRRLFFDEEISPSALLNALDNVRKIEHYEEPTKYPFDVNHLRKAVVSNETLTDEERLLIAVGLRKNEMSDVDFDEYVENNDIERNIERIKLVRTLKNISQNNHR